jgi:LysR family glycine cleavage system transcriptional activator
LKAARCLQFDHVHFVLQAAVDGLGFALTPRSLLGTDVAAGRLVCPLPRLTLPLQSIYYSRPANPSRETQLFADWLDTQGA